MAIIEIDEVAVDRDLYRRAELGSIHSRQKLREAINGLILYSHVMSVKNHEKIVTICQLVEIGVINSITLNSTYTFQHGEKT